MKSKSASGADFLITLCFFLRLVAAMKFTSEPFSYGNFCKLGNTRLVKRRIETLRTPSVSDCAFACIDTVNCLSYNFAYPGDICELNNGTGDPLVTQVGFSYFAVCSRASADSTRAFKCPVDDWDNDSNNWCLRLYVDPNAHNMSEWSEAQMLCLRDAQPGLACPSTKERYDILTEFLTIQGVKTTPWIGLFYNSSSSSWEWTNGDPYTFSLWENTTSGDPRHGTCATIEVNKGFRVVDCQSLQYRICSVE